MSVPGKQELWVLSLGGSLIAPGEIDTAFLASFRDFIRERAKGQRFVIVTGGGALCRTYQRAAAALVSVESDDLDWIGVHVTRINAHLLRTVFRDIAHRQVIKDPTEEFDFSERVLVAAGWKPGFSTDYDAVLLAKRLGSPTVVNLTNVDALYDRDPRSGPGARKIAEMTWDAYLKMIGTEWKPGLHVPFDPVASREAQRSGIRVVIVDGRNLGNLGALLDGKPFEGSVLGNSGQHL